MALERVQKIIAQAGIASRRKAEELVAEGVVTINGKVAKLGDKAEAGKDAIKVRGKLIHSLEKKTYLLFNKPKQVLSTLADPEGRPTLALYLDKIQERVYPVGRLDFNSEGLLLLTNDGAVAEQLQKSNEVARVYHVKVKGHPGETMIKDVARGARIGEPPRMARPHSVRFSRELENKSIVEVVILGSASFDIKKLFEVKGILVDRIVRTAIGHLALKDLPPGQFRQLTESQIRSLFEQPELALKRLDFEAKKEDAKLKAREDSSKRPQPKKRVVVRPVAREGSHRAKPKQRF